MKPLKRANEIFKEVVEQSGKIDKDKQEQFTIFLK